MLANRNPVLFEENRDNTKNPRTLRVPQISSYSSYSRQNGNFVRVPFGERHYHENVFIRGRLRLIEAGVQMMRRGKRNEGGKPRLVDQYSDIGIASVAASVRYQGNRKARFA